MINVQKVQQAVDLQKQMNSDIDIFGCTSEYNCKMLDRLIDNFNSEEDELFIKLMNEEVSFEDEIEDLHYKIDNANNYLTSID